MRKNKVFATTVIAALAAAQLAMPAMAAETNNGKENLGDKNNTELTQNLKKDGHTLFSVFETDKDVSGQVSYTIPLYVTMAAKSEEADMITPDGYYIQNTSADPAKNPIGVSGITVDTYTKWEIIAKDKATAAEKYQMTFTLTGKDATVATDPTAFDFPAIGKSEKKTIFSARNQKEIEKLTGENLFFSETNQYTSKGLMPITDAKLEMKMFAKTKNIARTDSATVPAFKVTYTISALDANGIPKPSTYVGDDKDQAYKEVIGVKVN